MRPLLELPEPRPVGLARPGQRRARAHGRLLTFGDRQPQAGPRGRSLRLLVEASMRTGVAWQRFEQVVGRVDGLVLARVLFLPAVPAQHPVAHLGRELLTPEELLSAPRDR